MELASPATSQLEFAVVSKEEALPVPGASCVLWRSDLDSVGVDCAALETTSDVNGMVTIDDVAVGGWTLQVEAPGYARRSVEIGDVEFADVEQPGAGAVLRLAPITLRATLGVTFELTGLEPYADATGYRVAHTHEGVPIPFDTARRATLELDEFSEPLYIKLFYPDGTESIRYLDSGLPEPGDIHELAVGGGQSLQIDLQIVPGLLEEIAAREAVVVASYRAANGDATIVGRSVDGPCMVEIPSIHADAVSVAFETVETGSPVQWANKRVVLPIQDVVATTLLVESEPTSLQVVDGQGSPVSGFSCDIRMIPDDTTWVSGGVSDEHGEFLVPRVRDRRCSLCGYVATGDREIVGIDVPVEMDPVGDSARFVLDPLELTHVEVLLDGVPLEGVQIDLVGTDTGFPYIQDITEVDGRTRPLEIMTRSRARVVVLVDEYWCPTPEFDLRMGRNAVEVFHVGALSTTSELHTDRIRSVEHDTTLADWLEERSVQPSDVPGGAVRYRVPVGEYDVEIAAGETRRVLVRRGQVTVSGL